jgi:hypothetical protein
MELLNAQLPRYMKLIIAQCVKEIAQFRRDRLTLALAFLLPFISLIIFGFAIRLESKDIPLIHWCQLKQKGSIGCITKNIRFDVLSDTS